MHTLIKLLSVAILLATGGTSAALAGPSVVPHPKSNNSVKAWNNDFEVVREFNDPVTIKIIQDAFFRATKVGDTRSHLKATTHKIDFSDRWLIDLKSGEIGVLSKTITNVYQLNEEDLKMLQQLIPNKAEQADAGNRRSAGA